MSQTDYVWAPQPGPQHALMDCPMPLVFFGGARGGGKTDGVLGKWAVKAGQYGSAFNAMAFRRTTVSFEDAVQRARQIYEPIGARFTMGGNRPAFVMPGGGRIGFGYIETVDDANEYQGRNLTDVWIEEVGQYPSPDPIDRLFGVLRSASGVPIQMVQTGNPGGAGQHWVASRYRLIPFPAKPLRLDVKIGEGSIRCAVIPSRIEDNRIMLGSDPEYVDRLSLVGSKALVKAWLRGDWSAVEGAFFDCWDSETHILTPFPVPKEWLRFRSMDWGFASPFSVGWWAVVGDARVHDGKVIPRGALIRYREWYGASGIGKGARLINTDIGKGIVEREAGESVAYGVLDPSAFKTDGGPSIAEQIHMGAGRSLFWPADNTRIGKEGALGGWAMMRNRLVGHHDMPMLYVFDTCRDFIRTVPVLQHDPDRAEDLDTEAEDHIADEARYACMSRPWIPPAAKVEKPALKPGQIVLPPARMIRKADYRRIDLG